MSTSSSPATTSAGTEIPPLHHGLNGRVDALDAVRLDHRAHLTGEVRALPRRRLPEQHGQHLIGDRSRSPRANEV
jgi:hypothetical protein